MLLIDVDPKDVILGQGCLIHVNSDQPGVEVKCFVSHRGILYLKPLIDWSEPGIFHFFPEAPGEYCLSFHWRCEDGRVGWQSLEFAINSAMTADDGPQKVRIDAKTEVWVASRWEAGMLTKYEAPVVDFMRKTIQSGWVVYDIGANIGLYSILCSRLSGYNGFTYCVEANPVCIYLLRTNMAMNSLKNYQILPLAASDEMGSVNFTLNYGNLGLGVIQRSPFYASKIGHEVSVSSMDMTTLIETHALRPPNMVKIDVEGAEGTVIQGLDGILSRYRPHLMIEIHGQTAAAETIRHLRRHPYYYEVLGRRMMFSDAQELLEWFPDAVLQVSCQPFPST